METQPRTDATGLFEARYTAFLTTVTHLRPRLHRYCARMTGSVLDGEDVMQDALFEAYRNLDRFDERRALDAWLFGIAHHRCIDFLRRRQVRESAEAVAVGPDSEEPIEPPVPILDHALERLVTNLPPKERACVLLKDVFDYSLDEIAELVDSTGGGVKAALNRGRTRLAALPPAPDRVVERDPEMMTLLNRYVELFNRRDWDGVRALTSADAQLRVSDCFKGRLADSPYFTEYKRDQSIWKLVVGEMDGQTVLLVLNLGAGGWKPVYPVRVQAAGGIITRIADYYACPWILPAAAAVVVSGDVQPH